MSIKVIERMIDYCNELLAAFKLKNKKQVSRWLSELEAENKEELAQAKEFGIAYLLSLHGMVANKITQIKRNINNPDKCTALVLNILDSLKSIIDQREVRDKIIKETIHPILKEGTTVLENEPNNMVFSGINDLKLDLCSPKNLRSTYGSSSIK